jgi:tRNA A37 methylthiotransferase MiaB
VTGCAAQIDPNKWNSMPEVNFVVGNREKLEATFWKNFNPYSDATDKNNVFVDNIMETKKNK